MCHKIKDMLLLVVAFTVAILLSINCHLAGSAVENPPQIDISTIYGIDVSRTYEQDGWKYFVEHLIPPRDRYHHEGHLYYEDIKVPDGNRLNDFIITPFGTLYWHGHEKVTRYGPQGWMRIPNPRYPAGDEIDLVDDYDFVD